MLQRLEHGSLLELRLDRPPANALSPELIAALDAAVRSAPEEGARAMVLSGREGMFSAGLDVPRFLELDRAATLAAWAGFFDLMQGLCASPIPVIAALTGHAPAGGCVLGLCCDQRVLAEGAFKIGLNEVQVGVRVPRPIHAVAVHVVGVRQAERLCTTAELLDPAEALRIGLVDELAAPAAVVARALVRPRRLTSLPPETLRRTRAVVRADLLRPFERLDEEALELFLDEWFSAEAQGALQALAARLRKP